MEKFIRITSTTRASGMHANFSRVYYDGITTLNTNALRGAAKVALLKEQMSGCKILLSISPEGAYMQPHGFMKLARSNVFLNKIHIEDEQIVTLGIVGRHELRIGALRFMLEVADA